MGGDGKSLLAGETETMRSLSLNLLFPFLLWTATSCYAYDVTQPPRQTPPLLPDDHLPTSKRGKKNATVILSSVCSGAVGAIIGSALAPQNLARQWVTVSAAGTVLLISAGVEGKWVGRVKVWWKHKQEEKTGPTRQKVQEVVEYSSATSTNDGDSTQASEVEIEDMGEVKPIYGSPHQTPPKAHKTRENQSSDTTSWSTSSSGDSSSYSPLKTHTVKVNDQIQQPNRGRSGKKHHKNLLMFWKRKKNRNQKEEAEEKPSIPPWSEFASEDTSRGYKEDHGDDDIGDGLGL